MKNKIDLLELSFGHIFDIVNISDNNYLIGHDVAGEYLNVKDLTDSFFSSYPQYRNYEILLTNFEVEDGRVYFDDGEIFKIIILIEKKYKFSFDINFTEKTFEIRVNDLKTGEFIPTHEKGEELLIKRYSAEICLNLMDDFLDYGIVNCKDRIKYLLDPNLKDEILGLKDNSPFIFQFLKVL